jgi:glycosyltransferase involved in cell wall biosynthesis
MRAWEQVASAASAAGVTLTIAGAGPLEAEVATWADRTPATRVVGMLDRPGCWELLRGARAVAVPSRWAEPFGLAAVEAMCAATVPVVPDDGSFPHLVTDGVDGLMYRQGDVGALASRLAQCVASPQEELGRAARITYEARFTPKVNLAALEAIYEQAQCRHAARRSPSGRA